jgi:hypothetical protein
MEQSIAWFTLLGIDSSHHLPISPSQQALDQANEKKTGNHKQAYDFIIIFPEDIRLLPVITSSQTLLRQRLSTGIRQLIHGNQSQVDLPSTSNTNTSHTHQFQDAQQNTTDMEPITINTKKKATDSPMVYFIRFTIPTTVTNCASFKSGSAQFMTRALYIFPWQGIKQKIQRYLYPECRRDGMTEMIEMVWLFLTIPNL